MRTLNGAELINGYQVYLPTDKKTKAPIRGLWHSPSGLCYDYIRKTYIKGEQLGYLKKRHKQKCLFYTRRGRAYIWYSPSKIEELKRWRYFAYNKQTRGLKVFLKDLLNTYGGFTLYIKQEQYLAEVWC